MTEVAETKRNKVARRQVDKFEVRRTELAVATLHTLADLGYARTSLREIAQKSEFSHGVLHYYFADKQDLITRAVRQYEAVCVTRYDGVIAEATSAPELRDGFIDEFFASMRTDAPLHRLWYDLRNQSLFEESFRADVEEIDRRREEMIWQVIGRCAELAQVRPATSSGIAYAMIDGIFQRGLRLALAGADEEIERLQDELRRVLVLLVDEPGSAG
ncbi:TetR/AcrR family transcriptional regulator [Saccharopolyspora sp. 6V]|uniref:TetR/AcrR family transcriptional regulator n=1 Tax=Saccharopolyspora sp. 6V TaxID=2877239 RepID=UPI001CD699FC|nr:TetR family transcriptional regulator [Saccharopolyspora sp. 6V]MCA1194840.1 TetR family transcriptional regulator [Saccharopolyspora sp. 6V]